MGTHSLACTHLYIYTHAHTYITVHTYRYVYRYHPCNNSSLLFVPVNICYCQSMCMCVYKYYPVPVYFNYVCQLIFSGNTLHYCVHCTLHVGCCSKSLSESSGSEVYTDPPPRLGSKRSCSEGSMGESSLATVEGMLMCARSLVAYHVCIGGTFMPYGYV